MTADPETLAARLPSARQARRLTAALLLRAARDAVAGDPTLAAPARSWLADEGADLAGQLDIDAGRVTAWIDGLPGLVQEGLPGM